MKTLGYILIFSLPLLIHAQGNIMYDAGPGKYYYVFGDKVNVRSEPDKNSSVIVQLGIGDSVQLIEVTNTKLEMNGIEYPWVKVKVMQNGKSKTGHVWGGLISFYHESYSTELNGTYDLYMGPVSYDPTSEKFFGEARLCNNGMIIGQKSFELMNSGGKHPHFDMGVYPESWYIPSSYRNMELIIAANLTVESCGPTGNIIVIINDGKIIFCASELGSYSGDTYMVGNYFVFPWDKGGMKEYIFEYYQEYSANPDSYEVETDTTYLINTYTKKGGEFILDKKD